MTSADKLTAIQAVTEEILQEDELLALLDNSDKLKHYIGFEISGQIHLGSGIMTMRVIKALQDIGVHTSIWLADWHSMINKKLGGDISTIQEVAIDYFKEAMIAAALCVGADPSKIEFLLANDVYDNEFWQITLDVASHTTLSRGKRSVDIAGREAGDDMPVALLFYPPMQAADIFKLGVHLAHAGTDQRKAHVLARTVAPKLTSKPLLGPDGGPMKPIALHHHLLMGLGQPPVWPIPADSRREMLVSMKMSKSQPDSAVFLLDSPEDIARKIKKAFCPPNEVEYNPVLDWVEHVIFPLRDSFELKRPESFGGDVTFSRYEDMAAAYKAGDIHPGDLKSNVSEYLIAILEPARTHFEQPDRKRALEKVQSLRITR